MGALLLVPRISDSVSYRAYLERLGSTPFLRWWAERFAVRYPGVGLTIVCQTERQAYEARHALGSVGTRVIWVNAGTTVRSLALAVGMSPTKDTALLSFGFAYAPPDLLTRLHAHHVGSGNNYTPVLGLPRGTAPEIYASHLLLRLPKVNLAGLPTTPGAAVEMILRAASSASAELPLPIRARPFDAEAAYGAIEQRLPERIVIAEPVHIEIARYFHRRRGHDGDPLDDLRLWRDLSVTRRLERGKRVVRLAPRRGRSVVTRTPASRILFVSYPSAFSGSEMSLVQLVGSIDHARFEPLCLVGAEGLLARRLRETGARVIVSAASGGDAAEDARLLASLITEAQPHLLHLNAPSGPVPTLAPALWGIPVVSHVRVADTRGYGPQLKASNAIIAISKFVRREVLKLEIPDERVHVIYNGVDTRAFRPNALSRPPLREKFGVPAAAKVVLMTARFSPTKRHDVLLAAAHLVKPRVPDLFLLLNGEFFGESPTYDSTLDLIKRRGMRSWIRIIPFVEDIRELQAIADALVLCSEREPMGRCVIEAMAMGVPVIVADSGGIPEIVQHGKTGFIVPPGEVPPLADQIVSIFANRDICSRVVHAARHHVKRKFDGRRMAQTVMALYDNLLRPGRTS